MDVIALAIIAAPYFNSVQRVVQTTQGLAKRISLET
jgi:hypothetical protein